MNEFKTAYVSRCESALASGSHVGLRELLAWAADIAKQFIGSLDKEAVKEVVLEAYDKYVAPYDLPYIPNLVEPAVDAALRRALESGIDKLFESMSTAA